ncbi:RcnB family protein [Comamonas sp. BIGb0124]|uniref:RcnB family protein n=1 Tax=Comamonas sp. BIGb0124 TaxID=2485130 RepID=UPI001F46A376|nr:RcnB family protein [Comamonas sp. BIGb0124]
MSLSRPPRIRRQAPRLVALGLLSWLASGALWAQSPRPAPVGQAEPRTAPVYVTQQPVVKPRPGPRGHPMPVEPAPPEVRNTPNASSVPRPDPNWQPADLRPGAPLPPAFRDRQFVIEDWRAYGLTRPPAGQQWVQVGGQYLLVSSGGSRTIRSLH